LSISFDTNILVYAHDESDPSKHRRAKLLLNRFVRNQYPLAGQVLSEFLNVNHRKNLVGHAAAMRIVATASWVFHVIELNVALRQSASAVCATEKIQFYDAQIIAAVASANGQILLSEDMQDGRQIMGVTVINPFNPANAPAIAAALA
jgi:predicted nucleic acid-binding protein